MSDLSLEVKLLLARGPKLGSFSRFPRHELNLVQIKGKFSEEKWSKNGLKPLLASVHHHRGIDVHTVRVNSGGITKVLHSLFSNNNIILSGRTVFNTWMDIRCCQFLPEV